MWESSCDEQGERHVIPLDDLKPHVYTIDCWCKPYLDDAIIVHNSMDRREEYERGRKPT
jgi:hypothetical protein